MSESWKRYLKPEEAARLIEIEGAKLSVAQERRRIIDRCRKRAAKARLGGEDALHAAAS